MKTETALCVKCGRVVHQDTARHLCSRCKAVEFRTRPLATFASVWPSGGHFKPSGNPRGAPPPRS